MFASLKNKIREETGNDLSKLTAKITSSTVQKIDSFRGKSQSSTSSLTSVISSEGIRDDGPLNCDEYKRRLLKLESDFSRKLENKEKEWCNIISDKDRQLVNLEKDKEEAYKEVNELKSKLKSAEDLQQRLVEYQEDKDQLENYQLQELSKIKHLILQRDEELAEKTAALKEVSQQLEKVRTEVSRLRRQEERLSDVQQNAQTEVTVVKKNLENSENELEKIEDECNNLKTNVKKELENTSSLKSLISKLEKELQDEKNNSLNVQKTLSRVTQEKNAALLRNAEISQQIELVKQEKRRQEAEMNELLNKIGQLEKDHAMIRDSQIVEQKLRKNIADLEDQLADKNKNIRTLQLRLADMKKTLQHELRTPGNPNYHSDLIDNGSAVIAPTTHTSVTGFSNNVRRDDDDVNFRYLKHVVLKFLTGGDCEAQHLTKAISTILKFNAEEERLVNETIEWRRSWFGSRPKLNLKQKSGS